MYLSLAIAALWIGSTTAGPVGKVSGHHGIDSAPGPSSHDAAAMRKDGRNSATPGHNTVARVNTNEPRPSTVEELTTWAKGLDKDRPIFNPNAIVPKDPMLQKIYPDIFMGNKEAALLSAKIQGHLKSTPGTQLVLYPSSNKVKFPVLEQMAGQVVPESAKGKKVTAVNTEVKDTGVGEQPWHFLGEKPEHQAGTKGVETRQRKAIETFLGGKWTPREKGHPRPDPNFAKNPLPYLEKNGIGSVLIPTIESVFRGRRSTLDSKDVPFQEKMEKHLHRRIAEIYKKDKEEEPILPSTDGKTRETLEVAKELILPSANGKTRETLEDATDVALLSVYNMKNGMQQNA